MYAPSRDGQRFLINTIEAAKAPTPINVLLNWRPPEPRWRADGRELFYMAGDGALMAVEIRTVPAFTAGTPVMLFPTGLRPAEFWYYGGISVYAPSRDG